ncbi:MAG: glycosyltransferase family 2 protein [Akkermansiaceae bacterium]|nr:glycosyltransferase family 2 protein [Akkermansiaceae bacterium]
MFSILILTRDEEQNIRSCMDSVSWCDDVVVLDSLSSDRTQEIARENGARVFERKFDDFGSQRNFALDEIDFKYPWVFHLDADEHFNPELREECERVIGLDDQSAFLVPNRIIFLGTWIRRSTQYPYPQVRLIKVGEVRFAKSGHGQREDQVKRGVGHINVAYDHYNFSKGISDWVSKHNRYATEEALDLIQTREHKTNWSAIFRGPSMNRKRALKSLHARTPGRWILKFLYLYFMKRGFLDGYPGFVYCVLQGFYDFLISVKARELRLKTNSTD